jgi:membrane-bound ClpP family serine protease
MRILIITIILTAGSLLIAAILVALSRHRKSGSGKINLLGAIGATTTKLDPEGAIIVSGELWPALSNDGQTISDQERVRVIGFREHLALVESCDR